MDEVLLELLELEVLELVELDVVELLVVEELVLVVLVLEVELVLLVVLELVVLELELLVVVLVELEVVTVELVVVILVPLSSETSVALSSASDVSDSSSPEVVVETCCPPALSLTAWSWGVRFSKDTFTSSSLSFSDSLYPPSCS